MSGPDPRDPFSLPAQSLELNACSSQPLERWKIAYSPDWGVFAVDREIVDATRAAVRSLSELGAVVEEPPEIELPCSQSDLAEIWRRQVGIVYAEMFASFRAAGLDLLRDSANDIPDEVREMATIGAEAGRWALDARQDDWIRTQILQSIECAFQRYDLIATPTLSCFPVLNADDGRTTGPSTVAERDVERCIGWCLTHPINFTGHPAASVPAGRSASGLPIGMQIVGRRFEDSRVLSACAALEQTRPWDQTFNMLWQRLDIGKTTRNNEND